jgi:hypothetical protein
VSLLFGACFCTVCCKNDRMRNAAGQVPIPIPRGDIGVHSCLTGCAANKMTVTRLMEELGMKRGLSWGSVWLLTYFPMNRHRQRCRRRRGQQGHRQQHESQEGRYMLDSEVSCSFQVSSIQVSRYHMYCYISQSSQVAQLLALNWPEALTSDIGLYRIT